MKVVFVINSLSGAGGAERVVSIMANYWSEKGWLIKIVTFEDEGEPPFYQLHPAVKHMVMRQKSKKKNILFRIIVSLIIIFRTRKSLLRENPDYIISFASTTNIKVIRTMLGTGIPVIVSERNFHAKSSRSYISRLYRNWLYLKAYKIVFQTRLMLDSFPPRIRLKGVIIPNPIPKINNLFSKPEIDLPKGKILFAVGHMSHEKIYQKGLDLLIPVFAILSKKHPQWNLVIINDGPEKHLIEKEIQIHNLQNRVFLPGKVSDIFSTFAKGDLFVLSSRYEGFPNALCEAMACGLPVVSFDCPSGPGDIVRHGIDGILVPPQDQEGMEKALDELMSNENLRKTMGKKAAEIVERFSVEKIMGKWEEIIS